MKFEISEEIKNCSTPHCIKGLNMARELIAVPLD
jgi:hypothetical protein